MMAPLLTDRGLHELPLEDQEENHHAPLPTNALHLI